MSHIDEILELIRRLTIGELAELRRRLDEPPYAGVREPRRPLPSSGSASVFHDYKGEAETDSLLGWPTREGRNT